MSAIKGNNKRMLQETREILNRQKRGETSFEEMDEFPDVQGEMISDLFKQEEAEKQRQAARLSALQKILRGE